MFRQSTALRSALPIVAAVAAALGSHVGAGGDEQLDHAHVAFSGSTAQQPATSEACIALFGTRPYPEASSALTSAEAVTSTSMTRKWLVSAAC